MLYKSTLNNNAKRSGQANCAKSPQSPQLYISTVEAVCELKTGLKAHTKCLNKPLRNYVNEAEWESGGLRR